MWRPQSASLHPITLRHNSQLAQSTGALFVKHDEQVMADSTCRCGICRSPRGAWRHDELHSEVQYKLLEVRKSPWISEDETVPSVSTKAKIPISRQTTLNLKDSELVETSWIAPGGASDNPFFNRRQRLDDTASLPSSLTTPMSTLSPMRKGKTLLDEATLLDVWKNIDAGSNRRPTSAPAAGRSAEREKRARAVVANKRRNHHGYVQRCREAWDSKMAIIDSRQRERAQRLQREAEAREEISSLRIQMQERLRGWATLLYVVVVLQSLHELAISGRILKIVSMGGEAMQKTVDWQWKFLQGKDTRARSTGGGIVGNKLIAMRQQILLTRVCRALGGEAPSSRPPSPVHIARKDSTTLDKLNMAVRLSVMFPELRRGSVSLAAESPDADIRECLNQIQLASVKRQHVWKKWTTPIFGILFCAKLSRRHRSQKSGRIINSFLRTLIVYNHMHMAVKQRMGCIRKIQRFMKKWLDRERTRVYLISELLDRCEGDIVKRRWAEEDRAVIIKEGRRLTRIHAVKERKQCERVIAVAKENYRRYMHPKSDADFFFVREQLDRFRMPLFVRKLLAHHVIAARKTLVKRKLAEHAERHEKYMQEVQMWHDIEQAIQLIDPSGQNLASFPIAPEQKQLPFLVEESSVNKIVRRARTWCEKNRDLLRGHAQEATWMSAIPALCVSSKKSGSKLSVAATRINASMCGIVSGVIQQHGPADCVDLEGQELDE